MTNFVRVFGAKGLEKGIGPHFAQWASCAETHVSRLLIAIGPNCA
jgi:hypothetical protein